MSKLSFKAGSWTALPLILAVSLSACVPGPVKESPIALADRDISERTPDSTIKRQDAVNFFREQPVIQLQTDISQEFQLKTEVGDEVPNVTVQKINAAPMEFPALLSQIAEQVGMSWSISGENREALLGQQVYYVQRNEATLESVLEEISKSTNSFYHIEGDRIVFTQDRAFTTSIPRMADSQDVIGAGISNLGATNVFSDKLTGTMTFRANRQAYHAIVDLMKSFESGRDMIVYDFWIVDRTLTDNSGASINIGFTNEDDTIGIGSENLLESLASGGTADGALISGNLGSIGIEAVVAFLRSLGQTETLARPTVSMLSGGKSTFETGETFRYISSITKDSNDSTTDNTATSTDVDDLNTGLKMAVEGSHNGGVISTQIDIDISELVEFQTFETGGDVTLSLPHTTQRVVSAHLEARPGDIMVLGGIIRDRQEKSQRNLAGTDIPTQGINKSQKIETIIFMRPRLVQIRPTARSIAARSIEPSKYENVMGDVMEDESTAKAILEEMK